MDLQGLGALLTALGGLFTAKAGAQAGQLQGLLLGEELTERRKRMKMAEEAHQLQMDLARAQEAREAELFPLRKQLLAEDLKRRQTLFPYEKEAVATQVEASKLNLLNQRLWSMYQRGVSPSQITDPVLRAEYEPFFNYMMAVNTLQAVQSEDDLNAVLSKVSEELRPSLEILGRANLLRNQMQQQLWERQLRGLDANLAQGEFQLRTAKLNFAINTILNNINNEGTDWDKRTPQQKIEAVKKWIAQLGLEDVVPENFANMFQRVKSADTRQLALLQAQIEAQLQAQLRLGQQQFHFNRLLQQEAWMSNIVAGALQGGGMGAGGVAPVGFPAPPALNIFKSTYDNNQSLINESGLKEYLKIPLDIPVPLRVGGQIVQRPLSVLQAEVGAIYRRLGRPNATLTAEDISTLVAFDAGQIRASALKGGMDLDWNTALLMGKQRVVSALRENPAYQAQPDKYQRVLNEWERAFEQNLQARTAGGGQSPAPNMPRGQIGGQQTAPAQPRGGSPNYTSSARRRRE